MCIGAAPPIASINYEQWLALKYKRRPLFMPKDVYGPRPKDESVLFPLYPR
jgi:hypothetical protein